MPKKEAENGHDAYAHCPFSCHCPLNKGFFEVPEEEGEDEPIADAIDLAS
jgi:hypothetical protein